MSRDDPVIITSSISGAIANREQRPANPYTPEKYGPEPRRIVDDGGAMIPNHAPLLDMGLLHEPLQISCVMGVNGGIRPNARNLAHMAENVPGGPDGANEWGVIGISRDQWMLVAAALTLGGNVRVGLEDNFYLPDGTMARSNGDLIAKAREMTEDVGRRPATPAEARELLGVPTRDEVTRREARTHPA